MIKSPKFEIMRTLIIIMLEEENQSAAYEIGLKLGEGGRIKL